MPIHVLPESVAAQIAAGEVVERPASVVKELLENSLDAGATALRVEIEGGGRRLIRITDDGCGIPAQESELAFVRYATSKLETIDDLYRIETLGFRGEALASIAAVAQVTLLTRTENDATGTMLRLDGGRQIERRSIGTPVGTVITVENLFFNTPARFKFLKSETTERRHIDMLVTRYAMAYPTVRFTLVQDGRVTFGTSGNGELSDVLVEALGIDIVRHMLPVTPIEPSRPDLPYIAVSGYTGSPDLNRNTRSHITLFVNGRHIQDSSLSFAVARAYHTLMPSDRYPVAVVMIDMPPADVDVNVHPTKAEVRFRSPEAVFSAVQRAVRRAVIDQAEPPTMSPRVFEGDEAPASPGLAFTYPPYSSSTTQPGQLDLDLPHFDAGRRTQQIEDGGMPITSVTMPDPTRTAPLQNRPRTLPPLRVVGQVGAMYIVAEGPAGMYLIDQHAAHERILYEQFMAEQATKKPIAQQTLSGVTVDLDAQSARLIEENLSALGEIGFDLESFGTNTYQVRAVPSIFADRVPADAIAAILEDLQTGDQPGAAEVEAQIVLRICKAAAIKAGQTLSYDEMQALIRQLERCASPRTCPHGRPTLILMSAEQLAKEFGRT